MTAPEFDATSFVALVFKTKDGFGETVKFVPSDLHDTTKTQLAKVVEALWEIRLEYDPSDDSLNSRTMYDIACDVLAEIEKGGV